jgi:hypothetical protein
LATSTNSPGSGNINLPARIRIAAFGHRGVGKSTYLTALYAMLVNNIYRGIDFEYTDDDTAAKLAEYLNVVAENYSNSRDWQLPPTISMPQELHFLLRRNGQEYHLNLIDYRGESTTIGEMTQNKDLLDFFSTCNGLMLFNSNEADENDRSTRRANHLARHQDLKYLFSNLKNRSGKQKLQIPVAMVYTKSDKIDFGNFSLEDWIESNNSSLMETLLNYVQTFKTVFLSSQMAFINVMEDDRFRLTETERSGKVIKCDTDVAYPLFWLIDQIKPSNQIQEITPKPKKTSKWWFVIGIPALIGTFVLTYAYFNNRLEFAKYDNTQTPEVPTDDQKISNIDQGNLLPVLQINGKWPEASARLLSASDLQNVDKPTLRLIRNEIFARHGYLFKSDDLRSYFGRQPWYVGKYLDCNEMLTYIEKKNINIIKIYEKK